MSSPQPPTFALTLALVLAALLAPLAYAQNSSPSEPRMAESASTAHATRRLGLNSQTGVAVWFEVNLPRYVKPYLAHADQWQKVGTLIVSTIPSRGSKILKRITAQHPHIIPGLKTVTLLRDNLTNPRSWQQIAKLCNHFSKITASPVVVLENESAFEPYWKSQEEIDYKAVERAIRSADWQCEIWWYPSVTGRSPRVQRVTGALAKAGMRAIPKCHLINNHQASVPTDLTREQSKHSSQQTNRMDNDAISIVYIYGKRFWSGTNIKQALEAAGKRIILYPGTSHLNRAKATLDVVRSFRKENQKFPSYD